jgi:non-homologous end joining protein Ku
VEKNSQNHHRLNAKNAELKFLSHSIMDHMAHMDLTDLMDHYQKSNAQVVEKKLNSHIILIIMNKIIKFDELNI